MSKLDYHHRLEDKETSIDLLSEPFDLSSTLWKSKEKKYHGL